MKHLSLHSRLRICSADTILRAIEEPTCENTIYILDSGKSYDFNIAANMNKLLVNALLKKGLLEAGKEYDLDFDHQYTETGKFDAKPTYKKLPSIRNLRAFHFCFNITTIQIITQSF